jgi:hypothetical protein
MRSLLIICALARMAAAEPTRCTLDRRHYQPGPGFGEALVCDGKRMYDVLVRFDSYGSITGLIFTEYQGEYLRRSFQLYADGTIAVIAENRKIKGGFYAQSRGTRHILMPRGYPMSVEKDRDQLIVHDAGGHTWVLATSQFDPTREQYVSHVVKTIDGAKQPKAPIAFTEKGIVGVDFAAAKLFFLEHHQPNLSGMANRRTKAYREMKSVFHDTKAHTCAVANDQLFVPNPNDPNDPADMSFGFPDDDSLLPFLAKACPKLDVSIFDAPLAQQ